MTFPPEPWGFFEGVAVGLWAMGVGLAVGVEVAALQQRRLNRRRLGAREQEADVARRQKIEGQRAWAREQEAATEALIAQSHDSQAMLRQACDDLIAVLEAEHPVCQPEDIQ